ncbi:MAG: hypothetical protein JW912_04060 [Sedimentisphaerales bacterium]|nr:hypothetical protein [Sedimentisphaerales bacterium]
MRRLSKNQIIAAGIVCLLLAVWPQAVLAQGGDDCSTATVISALPYTDTGDTTGQTDDYDEICPYDAPGSPDVVYSYTPASNITVDIDLCNSAYDTKLYVYESTCGAYQSGSQIACNDDDCGSDGFKSQLNSVTLTGGNTYYIIVDGFGESAGTYEINVTERIVLPGDVCSSAIEITSLPYTDTGTTVSMNDDYYEICYASAAGAPDVVYSYTPSYSAAVRIELCNSSYDTKVYVYEDTCGEVLSGTQIACNDDACGTDGSRSRIDYVVFNLGSTYYIVVDGYGNYAGDYELTVSLTGAITGACCDDTTGTCTNNVEQSSCTGRFTPNTTCAELVPPCGDHAGEDCANATVIPSLPYSTVGVTTGANNDYYESCTMADTDGAPDVVYSYTPIVNEVIDISSCNSEFFNKLFVYENTCGAPGSGTHIACDDGSCDTLPPTAEITGLSLTAGNTYYIIVDGAGIQEGLYLLDITSSSSTIGACCDDSTGTCQDGVAQENCTGRFSANTLCSNLDPPCGSGPTLDCPANTLYGQPPYGPDDFPAGPFSEEVFGDYIYDNFTGITAPICDIHWWGFQMDTTLFEDCTESNPSFDITFYADNAGQPGTAVCSYQVTPTVTPTGIYFDFGGIYNQYIYYSVDLSTCCTLTDGWVSITGQGDENCWFLWIDSGTGDGIIYSDISGIEEGEDLNFCLTAAVEPDIRIEPLLLTDSCPADPNEEFIIYNDGTGILNVTDISTPAWVLGISPPLPYSIAPSGSQPVTVTLDCCQCAGRTQLQVTSDDPDENPYPGGVFVKVNALDGDLNDDCEVDMNDFSEFAAQWHQDTCTSPDWCDNADIDQSGDVDLADLAEFASTWTGYLPLVGCP